VSVDFSCMGTDTVMDEDLDTLSRDELLAEVRRRHHPALWGLLPERVAPAIAVPPWPEFLRGCVRYRESLDER
jgi:hypothetical protein